MEKLYNMQFVDNNGTAYKGYVEMSLKYKEADKPVFSASGYFKEKYNGRWVDSFGGQCLDSVKEIMGDTDETFNIIYGMWKKYHLNDMKPDCEHQRSDEVFQAKKSEKIIVYKWLHLNKDIASKKREVKEFIKNELSEHGKVELNESQKFLYNLKDCIYNHIGEYDTTLYNHKKEDIEYKTLNWIRPDEHPDGLLTKACPVCGYKYGSSWVYMPIDAHDLIIIKGLLEG